MARNISVKVPTATLIAEIDEAIANYPAKREEYEKADEAYKAELVSFISKYLASNSDKVGYDYADIIRISRAYNGRVELAFDTESIQDFPEKPVEPQRPNQTEWFGREHTTRKSLLEKNLKILRMTSQDEVNASTYGAIMEIL